MLIGAHHSQDPRGHGRIGCVGRMKRQRAIVVVDLEEGPIADLDRAEQNYILKRPRED